MVKELKIKKPHVRVYKTNRLKLLDSLNLNILRAFITLFFLFINKKDNAEMQVRISNIYILPTVLATFVSKYLILNPYKMGIFKYKLL